MKSYAILEVRAVGDTLYTRIQYLLDGIPVEVDVPHFQPDDSAGVLASIVKRASSEADKLTAKGRIEAIMLDLVVDRVVEITDEDVAAVEVG